MGTTLIEGIIAQEQRQADDTRIQWCRFRFKRKVRLKKGNNEGNQLSYRCSCLPCISSTPVLPFLGQRLLPWLCASNRRNGGWSWSWNWHRHLPGTSQPHLTNRLCHANKRRPRPDYQGR